MSSSYIALRQCLCGTKHMLHTRTMPSLHEDEAIKTIPNGQEKMVSSFKSYRLLEQDTLLVTQQKNHEYTILFSFMNR